jgi:uracil-DNA glycosylase
MQIEEIKTKLRDQLVATGWDLKLRLFLIENLDDIIEKLMLDVSDGNRFTPGIKDVFQPFIKCHYDNVTVVFLCDKPSIAPQFNDGLALSSPIERKPWGIAKRIHKAINENVYKSPEREFETTLDRWANQGVLLLNSSLTTRIDVDRDDHHEKIWKSFISYVMDVLKNREDIIYVFLGAGAKWATKTKNVKFAFPDIWKEQSEWDEEVFNKINVILEEKGVEKINW